MTFRRGFAKLCLLALAGGFATAGAGACLAASDTPQIAPPAGPVAAKAYRVLEKHCARCHQSGRLERLKPAKDFGNILKLDEIARNANLILPGNPDASPLYNQIARQSMPYDVFQEFSGGAEPSEDDLLALRAWIESLGQKSLARCAERSFLDASAVWNAIAGDLRQQPAGRRKGMRYITLTHLYNACDSDAALNAFRQGVVKLLNSLSRKPDILKIRTVDAARTIIAFHLGDPGWNADDWKRVLAAYPYVVPAQGEDARYVAETTGSPLAWLRGDWFAYTASRPPLYHELLRLPETFARLQQQLALDVSRDIENGKVRRAGFQNALVSRNNRVIERHDARDGVFWTSYDFAGNRDRQNIFEHPLGPGSGDAFQHDGGETVFSLPNGFNGYYLSTRIGRRLDHGPTTIVQDRTQKDLRVTNGISCMGCHVQGFRKASDALRAHVASAGGFPETVRRKVAALYPPAEEMNRLLDGDIGRFLTALRKAGIDPALDLDGVEIINALSHRYERAVDLKAAAAEFGMAPETFEKALGGHDGEARRVLRRLEQGTIPRDSFEAQFASLVEVLTGRGVPGLRPPEEETEGLVTKVGESAPEGTGSFDLILYSDKSGYSVDDLAVFTVKSEAACRLTLINVDGEGEGTVIFPNRFEQDNLIGKDREIAFPGTASPYTFRLKDKGSETVIAVCNADTAAGDGISHDFKTRSFTPLGNYRKFITRQIVVAGRERVAAGEVRKEASGAPAPEGASGEPAVARTAIKFTVR